MVTVKILPVETATVKIRNPDVTKVAIGSTIVEINTGDIPSNYGRITQIGNSLYID